MRKYIYLYTVILGISYNFLLPAVNVWHEKGTCKIDHYLDGKTCKIYHQPQDPSKWEGRGNKKQQMRNKNHKADAGHHRSGYDRRKW